MNKLFVFVSFAIILNCSHLSGQFNSQGHVFASLKSDTIQAGNFYKIAKVFADSARFDSALHYFDEAANIYEQQKVWDKYLLCRGFIFTYRRVKNDNYNVHAYLLESLNLSLIKLGKNNVITGNCYIHLGNLYADKQSIDTAKSYFQKALIVFSSDPEHNKYYLAKSYLNLGMMLSYQNKNDSALFYYERALEINVELYGENHLSVADVYNGIGVLYYYLGDFQKCLENFRKVTSIRQTLLGSNHPEVAKGYNNLGAIYEKLGKYKEALDVDEKALKIRLAVLNPDNSDITLSYNNIGNVYIALGQYELAKQYHLKALEKRLKKMDQFPGDVIMSYTNIGVCNMFMGIYDDAQMYLRKASKYHLEKFGEYNISTADDYNNIGDVFDGLGESDSAAWYFEKALHIRLKILPPNHPSLTGSYNNLGHIYELKGDFEVALRYFQKALAIDNEVFGNENPKKALSYTNIGTIYSKWGRYDKALEYFNESLILYKKQVGEDHPHLATTLNNISTICKIQNNYEKAIQVSMQSANILIKAYGEIHRDVASVYSDLAAIYKDKNDTTVALAYQNKAIDIYQKIYHGKHFGLANAYNNLGDIQYQSKQYNKALCSYQSALCANNSSFSNPDITQNPDIEKALNQYELLISLKKKSQVLYSLYLKEGKLETLKLALNTIDKTIKLIDNVRISYKLNDSKLHFVEEASTIFSLGADIAYNLYIKTKEDSYLSKLFAFSQQSKSQVLSGAVAQSNAMHFGGIPDTIIAKEKEIKRLLDASEAKLQLIKYNEKADSLSLVKLEEKVFQYSIAYKQISELLESQYPRYNEFVKNKNIPSLKEVQHNTDASTVVLDYFMSDSVLYIFSINNNNTSIQKVKTDSSFVRSIDKMLWGIRKDRKDQMITNSTLLYEKLISPVSKSLIRKRRLLIIPDKKLLYIPFEVLIRPSDKNLPDYLISHYTILYNYTAALAFNQREKNREPITDKKYLMADFVGFAPVFDDPANNAKIYTKSDSLSRLYSALRSVSIDGKNYRPLTNTKQEITNIVDLFHSDGRIGIGFFYDNATISNFKKEISKYRYIHIATHGISNDEFPELSGLVFMPEKIDPTDSLDDNNRGLLFASDIYHLTLNADLVVLSACESGTGKLVRGEGLMSLTRGFVYAGVPQIIYSLWKVDDRSTCELMTNFYKELLLNKPTEQALREAKLKLLNNPSTSSPKFWAAFALLGK